MHILMLQNILNIFFILRKKLASAYIHLQTRPLRMQVFLFTCFLSVRMYITRWIYPSWYIITIAMYNQFNYVQLIIIGESCTYLVYPLTIFCELQHENCSQSSLCNVYRGIDRYQCTQYSDLFFVCRNQAYRGPIY